MSENETESTGTGGGDIEDSEAVVIDENGRVRFRTLRVNKGSGERNGDENNSDTGFSED